MRDTYTTALMADVDETLTAARRDIRERIESRGCSEYRHVRVSALCSTQDGLLVQIDEALSRMSRRCSEEDVQDLLRLAILLHVHQIRERRA